MEKKIKIVALTMAIAAVMGSQAFAVTYLPNKPDLPTINNVELFDEDDVVEDTEVAYTTEDVEKVLGFYSSQEGLTLEEFVKYDLNGDGYLNAVDAAMMKDLM